MNNVVIDYTVYPDLEGPPTTLETDGDRADYVARVCAAWDFGVVPTEETFEGFAGWRSIFDRFPLNHSIAYHTFRALYDWPAVEAQIFFPHRNQDTYEGRTDPCEGII